MQRGKCSNFGNCDKADSREILSIPDGQDLVCPICKQRLTPVASGGARPSPAPLIIGLLALALLVGGGFYLVKSLFGKKADNPDFAQSGNTASQPTGTNPQPTGSLPPPTGAGDVLFWYERSDEKWMQQAADEFNKNHPGSKIVLDFRGSREGFRDILDGKSQPVVWNPADNYWVDKLQSDWQAGKKPGDIVDKRAVILKTKLVFVMNSDKAKVFQAAMRDPKFQGKTWALMQQIATEGWSSIQGQPSWGKLKLAQSDPVKSNSGLTTLALMFYEYRQNHSGVKTDDSGFVKFMKDIEGAANGSFFETTSKTIEALTKNSNDYDIAICYEQNAIKTIKAGNVDIRVVYPDPTIDVNFPAAVLKGSWVTSQRAEIAGQFVDYLMTHDAQKASIDFGFRPAQEMRSDMETAMSAKPLADAGLQSEPRTAATGLDTATMNDLVFQWDRNVGHR